MADYADREHYIPVRKADLIALLCQDLSAADAEVFRRFCTILSALYHFEHHQLLENLKNDYAPFDPDSVTPPLRPLSAAERQANLDALFKHLDEIMRQANFIHLDHRAFIEAAMRDVSDWGVNMDVPLDVFERLEIYVRGDTLARRSRRRWWKLFRKETVELPTFQRFVLVMKLQPHPRLGPDVNTDSVFLKIFKDIPKVDLEMLLPGARLRMPGLSRLKLGGSMLSGLGFIIYNIVREIITGFALALQFFYGPLLAIFGYGYKQWYGYQFTKQTFDLQITQSLYYQNLGSNAGVLFHLLDEAEEQECREAILAYFYLWKHAGAEGWTTAELDDRIETDLSNRAHIKVDFEVADALAKLERLNLVIKSLEHLRAQPIETALQVLDEKWDNFFPYHQANVPPPGA